MCQLCQGGTIDDVVSDFDRQIVERGFAIVPVGSSAQSRGWAYTIGLIDASDHPELVVAGYPLGEAVTVLDDIARAVIRGSRLDAPDDSIPPRGQIGARSVHHQHLSGNLMAGWHWYYRSDGRSGPSLRALQIVLPDGKHCFEHQTTQPKLDNPRHTSYSGMSRQERRGHSAPSSGPRAPAVRRGVGGITEL